MAKKKKPHISFRVAGDQAETSAARDTPLLEAAPQGHGRMASVRQCPQALLGWIGGLFGYVQTHLIPNTVTRAQALLGWIAQFPASIRQRFGWTEVGATQLVTQRLTVADFAQHIELQTYQEFCDLEEKIRTLAKERLKLGDDAMEIISFLSSSVLLVFGITVGIGISTAQTCPVAAALAMVAFLIALPLPFTTASIRLGEKSRMCAHLMRTESEYEDLLKLCMDKCKGVIIANEDGIHDYRVGDSFVLRFDSLRAFFNERTNLDASYKAYKKVLCITVAMGIILPAMVYVVYCRGDEIMKWLDSLGLTSPSLSTPSSTPSSGSFIFPSAEAAFGPLQLWPPKPPT